MADRPPRTWPALELEALSGPLPSDFDDRLALALDDCGPTAVEENPGARWRIHFADAADRDRAVTVLAAAIGQLVRISAVDIEDQGWAARTQASLQKIVVGRFLVAPPWDRPAAPASRDQVIVEIEPSMGFGSGHHPSTRLCLRALQQVPIAGAYVIDVGTGSGILAIAACLSGAARIVAIDQDADAVTAARENVRRNGCERHVEPLEAALGTTALEAADIVVANLTAWTIRSRAGDLERLVRRGGRLVVSGFTTDHVPLVIDALAGLSVDQRFEEEEWVALVLRASLT